MDVPQVSGGAQTLDVNLPHAFCWLVIRLALICGCWFPFVQTGALTLSKAREARKFFR